MVRVLLALGLVLVGCNKKDAEQNKAPTTAPVTAGTVGSDGVRRVSVEANKDGYTPAKITGKPGEKLTLVFTRTFESGCISQVKMPDGKLIDLPMNKPVEVSVTVPEKGSLGFACGMDMVHGEVVPAT